jgi:hypothetical protein
VPYSEGVQQQINFQHLFWEASCKINGVFWLERNWQRVKKVGGGEWGGGRHV